MAPWSRSYRWYWACERRLLPGARHAPLQYEELLAAHVRAGCRWLDIGCGRRLLPPWRASAERALTARAALVVGADRDVASLGANRSIALRVGASTDELPFASGSFDLVSACMVLEHVADPASLMREVRRILAPGGVFLVHTPNAGAFPSSVLRRVPAAAKVLAARVLDGRGAADVFPTFYRANDAATVRASAATAGLDVKEVRFATATAVFAVVPPLALVELLWMRFVSGERRAAMRPNLLFVLSPRAEQGAGRSAGATSGGARLPTIGDAMPARAAAPV